jgi:hypothetical protein
MPRQQRNRINSAKPALDLPPPFRLISLREAGDAFAHARRVAGEAGAGTLVHVGRFDLAEFAVVLEPEEPLRKARRALYAGLVALADALAAHAPPELPITFDWPDAVRVDGGLVGGVRLAWPKRANEDEPPKWLVFAAMIRTVAMGGEEPGLHPLSAALEDEGFGEFGSDRLVESFAHHLMTVLDLWKEHGFRELVKGYLPRLGPPPYPPTPGEDKGAELHREIAENGDLLIWRSAQPSLERIALLPALAQPSWLDPTTGGPRR